MSNPLYTQLSGIGVNPNILNMLSQFKQFKQSFTGDPKAQVQSLLSSGRMTQAQYSQLQNMATQLMDILK